MVQTPRHPRRSRLKDCTFGKKHSPSLSKRYSARLSRLALRLPTTLLHYEATLESVFVTDVDGEPQLALLLLSFAHLLYGDPLLERAFSPSEAPSNALLEGYGAPPPIVFPHQRTKRMWYDLYLGLVVLLGMRRVGNDKNVDWAVQPVEHSPADAPCY